MAKLNQLPETPTRMPQIVQKPQTLTPPTQAVRVAQQGVNTTPKQSTQIDNRNDNVARSMLTNPASLAKSLVKPNPAPISNRPVNTPITERSGFGAQASNALAQIGRIPGGVAQGAVNIVSAAPLDAMAPKYANASLHGPGVLERPNTSALDTMENVPDWASNLFTYEGLRGSVAEANAAIEQWTGTFVPAPTNAASEFVAKAADTVGEAIPGVAAAMITGAPVLGAGLGAANAFTSELTNGSGNIDVARTNALMELGSEMVVGGVFNAGAAQLGNALGEGVVGKIAPTALDVIGEGVEEVAAGFGSSLVTGNDYTFGDAAMDFALGAVASGAMSASTAGSGAIAEMRSAASDATANTNAQKQNVASSEQVPTQPTNPLPELPQTFEIESPVWTVPSNPDPNLVVPMEPFELTQSSLSATDADVDRANQLMNDVAARAQDLQFDIGAQAYDAPATPDGDPPNTPDAPLENGSQQTDTQDDTPSPGSSFDALVASLNDSTATDLDVEDAAQTAVATIEAPEIVRTDRINRISEELETETIAEEEAPAVQQEEVQTKDQAPAVEDAASTTQAEQDADAIVNTSLVVASEVVSDPRTATSNAVTVTEPYTQDEYAEQPLVVGASTLVSGKVNPRATGAYSSASPNAIIAEDMEAQAQAQAEAEAVVQSIWTPTQVKTATDTRDRDRERPNGAANSLIYRGDGSRGQIYEAKGYIATFGKDPLNSSN